VVDIWLLLRTCIQNGFILKSAKTISNNDFERLVKTDCRPEKYDVLIAKDGSYLKHVFVWNHDIDVVLLSSIAILRPNLKEILPYFFSLILKQDSTKSMMSGYVSGSALPRIILKDFKKMKLIIPDFSLIKKFESIAEPIYCQINSLNKQLEKLEIVRDKLLSRLISGRLSVDNLDIHSPPSMVTPKD
jgi:type I restriction enzyme S subunit